MISTVKRFHGFAEGRVYVDSRDQHLLITAFHTALDWMAIAWRDDVLEGLVFGRASRRKTEAAIARSLQLSRPSFDFVDVEHADDRPKWVTNLVDELQQFAEGAAVDFSRVPLALDHLTPFARRVVAACRRIPWGQVSSYGQLAAICGSPGAARAVGTVMAKNRCPLIVPCHRVLAAGGALGGYSAPNGLRMKRRLLAMEAIRPNS